MSSPAPADTLTVLHHSGRETSYEQVTYWPWREGITVWDCDGKQTDHDDVQTYFANRKAG